MQSQEKCRSFHKAEKLIKLSDEKDKQRKMEEHVCDE
jgi:hypothetical protein